MKKFVAMLLVLVMALSMTAAMAGSSSSTGTVTTVTKTNTTPEATAVTVVWQVPGTEFLNAVLAELTALDQEGKAGSYFPAELGVAENMKCAEAVSLDCLDNAADYAPYSFEMTTTTAVAKGTDVVVLIGTKKGEEITWTAVTAVATEDNTLTVTLDKAQLTALQEADDKVLVALVPAA
jgi:hypothetical protein